MCLNCLRAVDLVRKLLLSSVVLVVWPGQRLQLMFGTLIAAATLLVTVQYQPYSSTLCQKAQALTQIQLLVTYVSSQVFYEDARFPVEDDTRQTLDLSLVAFNCGVFLFFILIICRGARAVAISKHKLYTSDGFRVQAPTLSHGHDYHLFLSHGQHRN